MLLVRAATAAAATEITVTTVSDASNGDVSSVENLIANPGPDGISLREGIEVTNNDPGTYTIRFAPALQGKTITLHSDLPPLTGGGVTVEGAGVTLRTTLEESASWCKRCALHIASSRNRLHRLTLDGFTNGVLIEPYWQWTAGGSLPTHLTLANNVVDGLVMRKIGFGIRVRSVFSPYCGAPRPERCWSYTTWKDTTITGNTIETGDTGIKFALTNAGDRVDRATVTGNSIRIAGHDAGIALETSGDSLRARISDVLIARNTVEGSVDIGINVAGGTLRGQHGTVEHVRVLDNRVRLVGRVLGYCCGGIVLQAGTDAPDFTTMVDPPRYLDDNVTRDVLVRGNSISGTLDTGVSVIAGIGAGGSRNRVEKIRIERNTIQSTKYAGGVGLGDGDPYKNRYATANRIIGVTIDANRITIGRANPDGASDPRSGGIVLVGGGRFGRAGAIRDVRITSNRIATTLTGIKLVGGFFSTARGNTVSCVRLSGNRITGARRAVSVTANIHGASGNRATLRC